MAEVVFGRFAPCYHFLRARYKNLRTEVLIRMFGVAVIRASSGAVDPEHAMRADLVGSHSCLAEVVGFERLLRSRSPSSALPGLLGPHYSKAHWAIS